MGLVNHLGHDVLQDLEVWTAAFYAQRGTPSDTDVERYATQMLDTRAKNKPKEAPKPKPRWSAEIDDAVFKTD